MSSMAGSWHRGVLFPRMHTTGSAGSRHLLSAPGPDLRHLCVALCDLIWPRCSLSGCWAMVQEALGCPGRHHFLPLGPLGQHSFFTEPGSVPPQAFGYALGSGSKDSLLSDNK